MSGPLESESAGSGVAAHTSDRHVRFVDEAAPGDVVLARFTDPAPRVAVLAPGAAGLGVAGESLDVVLPAAGALGFAEWLRQANDSGATPPVYLKARGVELLWQPGRVVLECDAEQAEGLLAAVAEFAHYEGELRRVEEDIARGWAGVEEDKGLAFEVTAADLKRSDAVGARMERTLQRRIRLARIEARLLAPDPRLTAAGQRLGEALREKAQIETRMEIVDGQLEVFEHVYEMGAQRMGEYRASRESSILEWIIVVLLAAEALLMAVSALLGWMKL